MKYIIVVYGSLLSGLHNHRVIGQYLKSGKAKLLGEDVIKVPYEMVDLGSFPGLVEDDGRMNNIAVEVYEGDDDVNRSVERLEGWYGEDNNSNLYNKVEVDTKFGKGVIYIFNIGWHEDFKINSKDGVINWKRHYLSRDEEY